MREVDDHVDVREKQCAVRQTWPLRPLETQGQLTQGTDK